jgi:putative hydrolase of the HAD superfamily
MTEKRFKAVIIDLDDTLFDTFGSCYPAAAKEACSAMVQAGLACTIDQCLKERENFFRHLPRKDVFEHLVARFGIRKKAVEKTVVAAGKKAFQSRKVEEDIELFPQAQEVLAELSAKYLLFLVTSGDPATQKQKVELLKIREFFTHVYYVNHLIQQRKTSAFLEILDHTSIRAREVLCVGDRRDREIAEGKRLGFVTCLLKRSHEINIQISQPEENADFEIDAIGELIRTCNL